MELISGSVAGSNNLWIIHGYFNVAFTEEEHSRFSETRSDRNAICGFQNVALMCDMVDLAQVGPRHTWKNCQEDNSISKRLDRVMVNSYWLNAFHSHMLPSNLDVCQTTCVCTSCYRLHLKET